MKRSGAAVLAVLALLLLTVQAPAFGQPGSSGSDADNDDPQFLKLALDTVTPNVVSPTSSPNVVVTATVTNVGDRAVKDISVRMQRAPVVKSSTELRSALRLDQSAFDVTGKFTEVADQLNPGQRKQFTLTLPARSATGTSLQITEPGIYPALLNVNGVPEFGSDARLDVARFLLPVLGLPADPSVRDQGDPAARPIPPPAAPPVATTLLWPLADKPRLAPGVPGSVDAKVRLVDDDLATSLAKGGRLEELVSSLENAVDPDTDNGGRLLSSTCLAVDPDLLITVANMTRGYLVLTDPTNPQGATRDGTGADAATQWLAKVRSLASRMCTVALPFAQVDLTAVRAVANPTLSAAAVAAPADVIDRQLGTVSKRGITWPDSGAIDDDTGAFLRGLGTTTTILAANSVAAAGAGTATTPDVVRIPSAPPQNVPVDTQPSDVLHAVTFDVATATALAAVGADPQQPSFAFTKGRVDPERDSRAARMQDAFGAVYWQVLQPLPPEQPRSILLAPPQRWSPDTTEAGSLLAAVSGLLQTGQAVARPFDALTATPPDARPFDLIYPQQAVDDAAPDALRGPVAEQAGRIDLLLGSLVADPNAPLTAQAFVAPLREDLLRTLSMSGRRDHSRDDAEATAFSRVVISAAALDALLRSVTVLAPGGVYTLASEESPLLLVARNDLPVGIVIRVRIDAPGEMKITDIGDQQLPPNGSRQMQIPARVEATRNLAVNVSLTTPTGIELGSPTRVSVRSNAYGKALAILTASAGALLAFLAGRRLWHRFRGQPDRADEGYVPTSHRAVRRSEQRGEARARTAARSGAAGGPPNQDRRRST